MIKTTELKLSKTCQKCKTTNPSCSHPTEPCYVCYQEGECPWCSDEKCYRVNSSIRIVRMTQEEIEKSPIFESNMNGQPVVLPTVIKINSKVKR